MSKFEKHLREYTVVGATAIFHSFVKKEFTDFYGSTIDLIVVIKNGSFYHYQIQSERLKIARNFLKKLMRERIDLETEYNNFCILADEYWNFVNDHNFHLNKIVKLFDYYKRLLNVAIVAMDCVDVLDELPIERQAEFIKWAEKTRKKEEPLYKTGELIYIPEYLKWLAKNHLTEYTDEELNYLVYLELVDFIEKNEKLPSPEELRKRKEIFFIHHSPDGFIKYCSGIEAHDKINEHELHERVDLNIKEFSGVSAYKGRVIGKVRIIKRMSDMSKFLDGEILVASMTEPAYLPIMKKALAFITDEGGVLCHAAIVSRELKKPCITGTKIATSVLKDGDIVEVDADNAVVRKL